MELIKDALEEYKHRCYFCKGTDYEFKDYKITSGIKPTGYEVPNIFEYRNHPPYSKESKKIEYSWYFEVFINGVCIWRKSIGIKEGDTEEQLEQYEKKLAKDTLIDMMVYGLSGSRRSIIEHLKSTGRL